MKTSGFSLIELIVTLFILIILVATAIPSFKQSIQNSRTKTALYELLGAIDHARSLAVFNGSRSVLRAKDEWHDGWEIFLDKNDDGLRGNDEPILLDQGALPHVIINSDNRIEKLISFISSGEGRAPGKANAGAFIAGSLTICPEIKGTGYKLILSRGGRTRVAETSVRDCNHR